MDRLTIGTFVFHKKTELYAFQFGDVRIETSYSSQMVIDDGRDVRVRKPLRDLLGIDFSRPAVG